MEVLGWWVNSPWPSSVEQVPGIQQIPNKVGECELPMIQGENRGSLSKSRWFTMCSYSMLEDAESKNSNDLLTMIPCDAEFKGRHRVMERD